MHEEIAHRGIDKLEKKKLCAHNQQGSINIKVVPIDEEFFDYGRVGCKDDRLWGVFPIMQCVCSVAA